MSDVGDREILGIAWLGSALCKSAGCGCLVDEVEEEVSLWFNWVVRELRRRGETSGILKGEASAPRREAICVDGAADYPQVKAAQQQNVTSA